MGHRQKIGVSKNRGTQHPKMDGENNEKNPMNPWMIWGENPTIFGNIQISLTSLGESSGFVSGRARRSFNQTALEVQISPTGSLGWEVLIMTMII